MALGTAVNAPSDFDFAFGDWQVRHRRLRERLVGCTDWVEFDDEMSTQPALGGFGNVEDNLLHLPEGAYRAIALRSFENGLGIFYAEDTLNGVPIRIRFSWITADPARPRWEQAFSADGGATRETNWTMDFRRPDGGIG